MVSVSLGNSCDFLFRQDSKAAPRRVVLRSGDVLLFGGPSRHILHSVSVVHQDTCPTELQALHQRSVARPPPGEQLQTQQAPPPRSFRLNLTFRHAPELLGHEHEERGVAGRVKRGREREGERCGNWFSHN